MNNVATELDWKRKYRALVREMETNERVWRKSETLLRRAGSQLAIAAMGQSDLLDRSLGTVVDALRDEVDAGRLTAALDRLSESLRKLPRNLDSTVVDVNIALVMRELVNRVGEAPVFGDVSRPLAESMERALADGDWVGLARALADTVARVTTTLESEKADLEAFLGQVERQLEQVADWTAWNREANVARLADTSTLESSVDEEMDGIRSAVDSGTDVAGLKEKIQARLATIAGEFRRFREREVERQTEAEGRAGELGEELDRLREHTRNLAHEIAQKDDQLLHDALTGVHSRYAYEQRLQEEFQRWQRHGGQLAFALWDIDHFKRVNDTLGHRAGDKLLRLIGRIIDQEKRQEDFLARIGGEEFVLLLPAIGADRARALVERMRAAVAETPFHYRGRPETFTVSCGLTEFRDGDTPEAVFDRADRALQQSKNGGRNRCTDA